MHSAFIYSTMTIKIFQTSSIEDNQHCHSTNLWENALNSSHTIDGSGKSILDKAFAQSNIKIFSTPTDNFQSEKSPQLDDNSAKYKIKASELESKLKQVEVLNGKLNEQLAFAQSEYNELEHKYESIKASQAIKVFLIVNFLSYKI